MARQSVAVIGAGVSGLTAAHLLEKRYDVTLFEAQDRLGGHAHTHSLVTADDRVVDVDSGFIVHNERTYPHLLRLFDELGVQTQDSEMSMSVTCEGCGLQYAGSKGPRGLFPRPGNAVRPAYLRLLSEVVRFHRHARRTLDDAPDAGQVTLGEFVARGGYSRYFVDHFLLPLVSAVWSAGHEISGQYPARYLFTFLRHHGMLGVSGSPQWRTVTGGSREYVRRVAKQLSAVHVARPVRSVRRTTDGVEIVDRDGGAHHTDRVVIATHADQALDMLAEPTPEQRSVLGAFAYSLNDVLLHTDASVLPRAPGARSAWNLRKPSCGADDGRVLVSYDMNRLMRLTEPESYVVTLNAPDRVEPSRVLARMVYSHPVYTPGSVSAQERLPGLDDDVMAFAGAYHGWGFHEDGCASGVRAAAALGVDW